MRFISFFLLVLLISCAKPKSVLICGDHECINKSEAKQYFEENLSIEVQIKTKDKDLSYDLVELNLHDKQNIQVFKKVNKKVARKLSREEIRIKRKQLKTKKKNLNKKLSITKKNDIKPKKEISNKRPLASSPKISNDICLKLKKCDIDSITSYLIKLSNEKNYPNISLKE